MYGDLNLDNTAGANDPAYQPTTMDVGKYNPSSTGLERQKVRDRQIETGHTAGVGRLAKGALVLDAIIAGDAIARRFLGNDDFKKAEKHLGILQMAIYDVNRALNDPRSPIPANFRTPELLSDITNVVLSGVSNSNNKQVVEIGKRIYNEFSKRRLQYDGTIEIKGPGGLMIMSHPKPNSIYDPTYGKGSNVSQNSSGGNK
jgi:hypothetical protein